MNTYSSDQKVNPNYTLRLLSLLTVGLLEWTQSKTKVNLEWVRTVKHHQKYTLETDAACVFEIQKGAEMTSCNMVRKKIGLLHYAVHTVDPKNNSQENTK